MFSCGEGCNGGYPSGAWAYWVSTGITSGDLYGGSGCQPYTLPPCDHHVKGKYGPCPSALAQTPACTKTCVSGFSGTYTSAMTFGASSYSVDSNVAAIQKEIMTNGPVEAAFTVYGDFPSYKSGVY